MKVMVFTEGTLIMPSIGKNVSREERVLQVKKGVPEIHNFGTYVPTGNSVEKLNTWHLQNADIYYLTSRVTPAEVEEVQQVLNANKYPKGQLLFRENKEEYKDVAERVMPDILIEDDCESIGGKVEMTYPHINPKKKKLIKSIVVKEFSGIDNLPDNLEELKNFQT